MKRVVMWMVRPGLCLATTVAVAWLVMLGLGAVHSIDPTMPASGFLDLWVPALALYGLFFAASYGCLAVSVLVRLVRR